MEMISNEKVNFNSLEQNIYKKMMELGRMLIQDNPIARRRYEMVINGTTKYVYLLDS